MHGKPGRADRITGRKRFRGVRAAWIEGNKRLTLIDRFYRIVDAFHIVAFVGKEGAFLQRNRLIRGREDISGDGRIGDIACRGQLVERQTGDAEELDSMIEAAVLELNREAAALGEAG